ncbi:conserved protein of unknown function [Denitratisoma oestradiolicum]|uniref:Uncharacterized protein n=2 Tax=Denitratisoma oestradiolicum TaxID=311182 RepID=A0A6S6XNC0_9PROT|nr:hypothetical protein [Denitratisoma oestradiolicum]TWO80917.1 hypothetical protein CBW56_07120 [Denitratisoma oestradiolicum]CAB1367316.1 conserved protein of unknown function [Denitratisoma oestradiolicum]
MAGGSIGPLLDADEFFNHQIVETFASVLQTDYSWTEKVCLMAAARDGSLQIDFGIGKYINRNVVDGYGGVSRGVEQWNVRASRELATDPNSVNVGPLRYEVIEPLNKIRVVLEKNDVQPIAFDLILEGIVPCVTEDREDRRTVTGYRRVADQIRYHQTGTARGWVEVDGVRTEVTPETWIMTRDHSWGGRSNVGLPVQDVAPEPMDSGSIGKALAIWNPLFFEMADGKRFAFHQYYLMYQGPGFHHERLQGHFEFTDGRLEAIVALEPAIRFNPVNKRFLGGEFRLTMADGRRRTLTARPVGDTGFHLGGGLYHGFDGMHHGQWRGKLLVEGEHFADCSLPEAVARLNQFRDCLIEVTDSETGARGWGNCQTYVNGKWPELGLPEG